jgi:cyclopropane-fatty-acyl-phospholipid synthase
MFRRVVLEGSIGLGESYVDGWWSCEDIEELAYRLARAGIERTGELLPRAAWRGLLARVRNDQSVTRARRVAQRHYDLDHALFAAFLGKYQSYGCGYFDDTGDLDEAQRRKLELVCKKLELRAGEHLLDIGGGWGELARYAAREHGVRVTSINISEAQMRVARERCAGLDVEIVRCDYRELKRRFGRFDKAAAIAMFTHVGPHNYGAYMAQVASVLRRDGIFVMEGVWGNRSVHRIDGFIDQHIFPGAVIPSGAQTFRAFEELFVAEDIHNFGPHYVKTLRAWNHGLQRAWPELERTHDARVRRTFEYFFLVIAGYFRARALQHWHLVLTPTGRDQPAHCRHTHVFGDEAKHHGASAHHPAPSFARSTDSV